MHMADALVAPAVAGAMYLASSVAAGYSIKKVRLTEEPKKIPLMGVMGAFVFAAQMINFTIPGTGSSGHLTGGMMLSALLGPYAGFIAMIGVLFIQCLFFADGGLLALGCNIWNMAFYGCFVGTMLIWRQMMRKGINKKKIVAASVIGCVVTLQLGACSVVLETGLSGVTELPLSVFFGVMQPIHLAIGLAEGFITAVVLCFVYEARPELLWTGAQGSLAAIEKENTADAGIMGNKAADNVADAGAVENRVADSTADASAVGNRAADSTADAGIVENKAEDSTADIGVVTANINRGTGKLSYRMILGILSAAAVVTGGIMSLFASAFPDGLEWSIEKLTGSTEIEAAGSIYGLFAKVQEMTTLLPDYGFRRSESPAGTSFSGVIGGILVLLFLLVVCKLCRMLGHRRTARQTDKSGEV